MAEYRVGSAFNEPRVAMRRPQPVSLIRETISPAHVPAFYAVAFPELAAWLNKHRIAVSGPPLTLSHVASPQLVEAAVAYPVAQVVPTSRRITNGTLPGGPIASMTVSGSHALLPEGFDRLRAWLGENGYAPGLITWTNLVRPPDRTGDQSACISEICWPIA